MNRDKIKVKSNGMSAVIQANSSPAFYICILVIIVAVWSIFSEILWPFIVLIFCVAIAFIYLLVYKPQHLMDSKTLFEWTKATLGSKNKPLSAIEGDIVKTVTKSVSVKASTVKIK